MMTDTKAHMVDLFGEAHIQIVVDDDTVWINTAERCVLRATRCQEIQLIDQRSKVVPYDDDD